MDSPFDETAQKFLLEVEDILLKALCLLHLAAHDVVFDVLLINLVSRQLAEVVLGLNDHFHVIELIGFQQSVSLELSLSDLMLVLLVENEVQNLLCFDVPSDISSPYISGCQFELLFLSPQIGHDHQFLQSVVEVFLIVVERRVLDLLSLLFLLRMSFNFSHLLLQTI